MAKPKRRDPGKERYWRRLLRQWRRSGLTGRAFCAEQGLSEPSFYAWRREIAKRDREELAGAPPAAAPPAVETAPVFVKVALARDASAPNNASASIEPGDTTATRGIDVVVSGQRVLRVRPGFDADLFCQLLRLLEERSC